MSRGLGRCVVATSGISLRTEARRAYPVSAYARSRLTWGGERGGVGGLSASDDGLEYPVVGQDIIEYALLHDSEL